MDQFNTDPTFNDNLHDKLEKLYEISKKYPKYNVKIKLSSDITSNNSQKIFLILNKDFNKACKLINNKK